MFELCFTLVLLGPFFLLAGFVIYAKLAKKPVPQAWKWSGHACRPE